MSQPTSRNLTPRADSLPLMQQPKSASKPDALHTLARGAEARFGAKRMECVQLAGALESHQVNGRRRCDKTGVLLFAGLLLAFFALPSLAQNPASAFDAANKLYDQGKFAEAASAFEKLLP